MVNEPLSNTSPTCATCKYFHDVGPRSDDECRRYPMVRTSSGWGFAYTRGSLWCGEWASLTTYTPVETTVTSHTEPLPANLMEITPVPDMGNPITPEMRMRQSTGTTVRMETPNSARIGVNENGELLIDGEVCCLRGSHIPVRTSELREVVSEETFVTLYFQRGHFHLVNRARHNISPASDQGGPEDPDDQLIPEGEAVTVRDTFEVPEAQYTQEEVDERYQTGIQTGAIRTRQYIRSYLIRRRAAGSEMATNPDLSSDDRRRGAFLQDEMDSILGRLEGGYFDV